MILKLLQALWPFIKELILGEKTMKEAIKSNKVKIALMILIFSSFIVNMLAVPRLYNVSKQYLDQSRACLEKDVEINALRMAALDRNGQPYKKSEMQIALEQTKEPPVPPTQPKKRKPTVAKVDDTNDERVRALREQYNQIKNKENSQN